MATGNKAGQEKEGATLRKKGLVFFSLNIFLVLTLTLAGFLHSTALILAVMILLLGTLVWGLISFQRTVVQPLVELRESVDQMIDGHLDTQLRIRSSDEIGQLCQSINDQAMNLQEVLLYVWNHVQRSWVRMSEVNTLCGSDSPTEEIQEMIQGVIAAVEQDNEDLKGLVRLYNFFEVKVEEEKLVSNE